MGMLLLFQAPAKTLTRAEISRVIFSTQAHHSARTGGTIRAESRARAPIMVTLTRQPLVLTVWWSHPSQGKN